MFSFQYLQGQFLSVQGKIYLSLHMHELLLRLAILGEPNLKTFGKRKKENFLWEY